MNGKAFSRSVLISVTLVVGPYIQAQQPAEDPAAQAAPTPAATTAAAPSAAASPPVNAPTSAPVRTAVPPPSPAPSQGDQPCPPPVPVNGPLRLSADQRVVPLRHGEGASYVTITNTTSDTVPLALAAQPLVDCSSNAVLSRAQVKLTAPDQVKALPPNATASVQVAFSALTDASVAQETLQNAGAPIGSLTLVEIDAPLNITLGGPADQPIDYAYNQPSSLTLKNGDAMPYHLAWQFLIEGVVISSGTVDLAANGSQSILLKQSCLGNSSARFCRGYSIVDPVHPTLKSGILHLSLVAPGTIAEGLLPARTLPLTLTMRRTGPTTSLLLSYGYAAFILLMGGLLSFLASSVLPVMQRKGDLRAQLQEIANRTSTISIRVDSYLRVLLRLERKRIEAAIAAASPWVPSSADPLTQVSTAMEMLCKRLAAAERLDELRRKHDQISGSAPPSVTDTIDVVLQAAADQLHSTFLTDAEVAAANVSLAKAMAMLDLLEDDAGLAKLIAANMAALKTRLEVFPLSFYEDLRSALPGVFAILDRGFEDPKNIVRPMFFSIDHGIAAIHLLLDYAMVRISVPHSPEHAPDLHSTSDRDAAWAAPNAALVSPDACAQLGNTARKRLLDRQCMLFELLGTLSWLALREAALLVQEMREDIYEEDVLAEITKPGQAEIAIDTQRTRPLLPIFFSIAFKDSRFNNAAALRRLVCHWCFPDGLQELSWKVCHYFSGRERLPATPPKGCNAPETPAAPPEPESPPEVPRWSWLQFRRNRRRPRLQHFTIFAAISGRRVQQSDELPVPPLHTTIVLEKTAHTDKARLVAEVLRFLIAFGIALAGLLSGALDQLSKLDFIPATIAILALGFGANSIKNLLTQPSAVPAPAPKAVPITTPTGK